MTKKPDQLKWAEQIGANLRQRRKSLGLSLEDLSRLSGSTVPTLSNIERGKRDVKLSTLVGLAAALRVEPASLFLTNEPPAATSEPKAGSVGYDLDDD